MMAIDKYIHELLLAHDCVSIPGFGGLVAQRFRAEINTGTNLLRPPSKRISYHKELAANSHLLLNKIVREEKITQAKASELIAKAVDQWQETLLNGDSIKLNSIGRFYLDRDGSICFNQSLESNFDLDSFGLDIFRATAIKRDVEIKEAVTTAIVDNYKKTEQRFPFWRAAAVFVGIGALLTVGLMKTDVSVPTDFVANFNPLIFSRTIEMPIEPAGAADEVKTNVQENAVQFEDVQVEENQTIVSEPEFATEPINVKQAMPFEVVVGSFKDISNANDLIVRLQSTGYNPTIIEDNSSFTKVSIEGFNSRKEAVKAMRAYKQSVNKGAWIYKR